MNKNTFKQLSSIDVKGKVEKKGKHDYISWATAWHLVKTEFPDAQRKVYECNETGLNFFTDGRTAYVKVGIIAMHGLGLSLWIGEDLNKVVETPSEPLKTSKHIVLDIGDNNWAKVLKFVAANKELGLPKIVSQLETKYSIKAMVKKELSKHTV